MIRNVLVALALMVVAFVIIVALQPSELYIERTALIEASPEIVFDQLDDFEHYAQWNPWDGLDPGMRKTYSGPESGVGAAYEWSGNEQVGAGRIEISSLTPPREVVWKLHFTAPFEATNTTRMVLEPEGEHTRVTWTLEGVNDFMGKAVGLVMDMDAAVGADYERGLAKLDALARAAQVAHAEANDKLRLRAEAEAALKKALEGAQRLE
jgi:uncharacterized protein YndB with AHSA1/START domain